MRVGIISDIHANLVALKAVLADAELSKVDRVICLGDVCDLGPEPSQVLELLRSRQIPIVQGNHDPFVEQRSAPPPLGVISAWCEAQLSEEQRVFLRELPATIDVDLGQGRQLLCVHGSPRDFDEGITPATTKAEFDQMLDGVTADVVCAGHTHVQLLCRHRGRLIVNVGSVGCPFDSVFDGSPPSILPWAEYAIVESSPGALGVDLRRVDYDVRAYVAGVAAAKMPGGVEWSQQWLANLSA